MKTTVGVVTWNASGLLDTITETLRGLMEHCRVCISDNASTDGTADLLEERLPEALVLRNPVNGGFGYGCNRIIETCSTDYLLFLNADASMTPDDLSVLEEHLCDSETAGVQPVLRLWGWPMVTLSAGCSMNEFGYGYDMDFMHFQPEPGKATTEVPCITAAASLWKTGVLKKVGGFDEAIFMYFEDVDLSLRVLATGMKLKLVADARGMHMVGVSSSRSRAELWELRSAAYLVRKYLDGESRRLPWYWIRKELGSMLVGAIAGKNPLGRLGALLTAPVPVEHVKIPEETLAWVTSPRPMRMPRPRPPVPVSLPGCTDPVLPGPGWTSSGSTGPWGFGCLKVPGEGGELKLRIRQGGSSGSLALWSNGGIVGRRFVGPGKEVTFEAEIPPGDGRLYVVPDRASQVVKLEHADFETP